MVFNKRFNKEINNFKTGNLVEESGKYNSRVSGCELISDSSQEELYAIFRITISHSINFQVKIIILKYYPFKQPDVLLNGKPYRPLYKCYTPKYDANDVNLFYYNYYFKRIVGDKDGNFNCPCCSSVLCPSNWHINVGLSGILKEIRSNIITRCRVVELIHAKKISDKYLGFNLPTIFQMI